MKSEKFDSVLTEGEQLLWFGQAEPFPVIDAVMKKSILIRILLCVAGFAVTLALYFYVAAATSTPIQPGLIAVLVVIFLYIAILPVLDRRTIRKKRTFGVTDRRVILLEGGRGVHCLNKTGLKMKQYSGKDGCVSIMFGTAANRPERKGRISCVAPLRDDTGEHVVGMSFYHIKDSEQLQEALNA